MKYISTSISSDFEFHDALFELDSYENSTLILIAQHVNIHKDTEQNPHPTDMELGTAKITFNGFRIKSFEPDRTWHVDENGRLRTDIQQVIFDGDVAEEMLLHQLRHGATVLAFGHSGSYYLEGLSDEPWFLAYFDFDSATVEWESFEHPAWYEIRKDR